MWKVMETKQLEMTERMACPGGWLVKVSEWVNSGDGIAVAVVFVPSAEDECAREWRGNGEASVGVDGLPRVDDVEAPADVDKGYAMRCPVCCGVTCSTHCTADVVRDDERRHVVDWLREQGRVDQAPQGLTYAELADAVEAGAHRGGTPG